MALAHSPRIITDSLRVVIDFNNVKSYPGSGNSIKNIIDNFSYTNTTLITTQDPMGSTIMDYTGSSAYTIDLSSSPVPHETWTLIWIVRSTGLTTSDFRQIIRLVESNTSVGYFYTVDTRQTTNTFVLGYQKDEAVSSWLSHSFNTNQTTWSSGNWFCFATTHNNKVFKAYKNGLLQSTQTQALNVDTYGDLTSLVINGSTGNTVQLAAAYLYERVLGDEEIKQNFNALRGRFNL